MTDITQATLDAFYPSLTPANQAATAKAQEGPMANTVFVKGGTDAVDKALEAQKAAGLDVDGKPLAGGKPQDQQAQNTNAAPQFDVIATVKEAGYDTETLPEGFDTFVKGKNISADGVKELLTMHNDATLKAQAAASAQWLAAANAEFNDADKAAAKAAVARYADQELKDILNASGLGNHPAVIRAFAKMGRR